MDERSEWLDQARCRGSDPEQFFARGIARSRPALRLCQACPVQEECLDYALRHDIDFGVWGGLTERQRRALQRRQYAAAG